MPPISTSVTLLGLKSPLLPPKSFTTWYSTPLSAIVRISLSNFMPDWKRMSCTFSEKP